MALTLYPTDRIPRTYTLSPVDAAGQPTTVTSAQFVLMPIRQRPTAATTWTAATVAANKFTVDWAGASATSTVGAVVVPVGRWDLYVRGIDGTYDDVELVERITAY